MDVSYEALDINVVNAAVILQKSSRYILVMRYKKANTSENKHISRQNLSSSIGHDIGVKTQQRNTDDQ